MSVNADFDNYEQSVNRSQSATNGPSRPAGGMFWDSVYC